MLSHPFITFGRQAVAGQPAPSAVQGSFVRRWGGVGGGGIVAKMTTYRETLIEPQQTDKDAKQ